MTASVNPVIPNPMGPSGRPTPELSVVIPAHNEAWCIAHTLDQVHATLHGLQADIVVVDDRSADATSAEVQRWAAAHPRTPVILRRLVAGGGKGAAVRAGVLASTGRRVAYIDADLDIPAKELRRLYLLARRAQLPAVVASKRQICWRTKGLPLLRRVVSVSFSRLVRVMFRLQVQDTQTGLKLFDGDWVRAAVARLQTGGFLFDVELLAAAQRCGLEVREIQVEYTPQRDGTRIGLRHIVACMADLVRIWYANRRFAPIPAAVATPSWEVAAYADPDA